ncbi:hypothetical protein [Thermogutta sp.]|uniref:hypothetical protein n=1 Tax=Thermogutta sp. TaxID=1962930 RepID=UPI003220738F
MSANRSPTEWFLLLANPPAYNREFVREDCFHARRMGYGQCSVVSWLLLDFA